MAIPNSHCYVDVDPCSCLNGFETIGEDIAEDSDEVRHFLAAVGSDRISLDKVVSRGTVRQTICLVKGSSNVDILNA